MTEKPTNAQPPKTPQEFIAAYQQLCQDFGLRLVARPVWWMRDDGSYSLRIDFSVEQTNQNERPGQY